MIGKREGPIVDKRWETEKGEILRTMIQVRHRVTDCKSQVSRHQETSRRGGTTCS